MEDLIKALQILLKYGNPKYPTNCSHDRLDICDIDPNLISQDDVKELKSLGFIVAIEGIYDEEEDAIYSYRFGSC